MMFRFNALVTLMPNLTFKGVTASVTTHDILEISSGFKLYILEALLWGFKLVSRHLEDI